MPVLVLSARVSDNVAAAICTVKRMAAHVAKTLSATPPREVALYEALPEQKKKQQQRQQQQQKEEMEPFAHESRSHSAGEYVTMHLSTSSRNSIQRKNLQLWCLCAENYDVSTVDDKMPSICCIPPSLSICAVVAFSNAVAGVSAGTNISASQASDSAASTIAASTSAASIIAASSTTAASTTAVCAATAHIVVPSAVATIAVVPVCAALARVTGDLTSAIIFAASDSTSTIICAAGRSTITNISAARGPPPAIISAAGTPAACTLRGTSASSAVDTSVAFAASTRNAPVASAARTPAAFAAGLSASAAATTTITPAVSAAVAEDAAARALRCCSIPGIAPSRSLNALSLQQRPLCGYFCLSLISSVECARASSSHVRYVPPSTGHHVEGQQVMSISKGKHEAASALHACLTTKNVGDLCGDPPPASAAMIMVDDVNSGCQTGIPLSGTSCNASEAAVVAVSFSSAAVPVSSALEGAAIADGGGCAGTCRWKISSTAGADEPTGMYRFHSFHGKTAAVPPAVAAGADATTSCPFPRRRVTWTRRIQRSSVVTVAAAAVYCLVCAVTVHAIVCRIDASDGLLAAAVAAGSAMPAAEVFSFPLCRLPYLVNSDVPSRDAPHVGLYSGGTIEIELELLPADTYANNLPLSEPRFYQHPRAVSPRRQLDTPHKEDTVIETASSSEAQQQQQTEPPSDVVYTTNAEPLHTTQEATSPAAGGSFARELAAVDDGYTVGAVTSSPFLWSSNTNINAAVVQRWQRSQREEEEEIHKKVASGGDLINSDTSISTREGKLATEEESTRIEVKRSAPAASVTFERKEDATSRGPFTNKSATGHYGKSHNISGHRTAAGRVVAGRTQGLKEGYSLQEGTRENENADAKSSSVRSIAEERGTGWHPRGGTEIGEESLPWLRPHGTLEGATPAATNSFDASLSASNILQDAASETELGGKSGVSSVTGNKERDSRSIVSSRGGCTRASSYMCSACKETLPVITSCSDTLQARGVESENSSVHFMYDFPLISEGVARVLFASSSLQRVWRYMRHYIALFVYSVVAAADLFFGTEFSSVLLPVSSPTHLGNKTHYSNTTFFNASRPTLSTRQSAKRETRAFPFSLLFSSLYSTASSLVTAPASAGTTENAARVHCQEEELLTEDETRNGWEGQIHKLREEKEEQRQLQLMTPYAMEGDSAMTAVTAKAPEPAEGKGPQRHVYVTTVKSSSVFPNPNTNIDIKGPGHAPQRELQGIDSYFPEQMPAVAGVNRETGTQSAAEQNQRNLSQRTTDQQHASEVDNDDEEKEGNDGRKAGGGNVGIVSIDRRHYSPHVRAKPFEDGLTKGGRYFYEQRGDATPHDTEVPNVVNINDGLSAAPAAASSPDGVVFHTIPDDPFRASFYESGETFPRASLSAEQQLQQHQQIVTAAAAWQRQLDARDSETLEDPPVSTVNNTYVLVMTHLQYLLYQQDSEWLRSFTAKDGIVANSYVPTFKRLTFTGPKLHVRVKVPKLDRYAVVLLNADGLDLRLRGRIIFLNPGSQQLSVEQIPLPKLLLFLMLLHLLTVGVLGMVMLSFRRRRWTRVHLLILTNLLLCALCFALDRSQTVAFEAHGSRNPILWIAARVCKKLQDIMALMAFILIALGWKTLRSQLTRIEVQFVAGLCIISLYLGLFEIILGGFQGTRYILHALGYVCVLVAINFNLALLHRQQTQQQHSQRILRNHSHVSVFNLESSFRFVGGLTSTASHVMDAGITPATSDLYHKYDAFRLYRGIFFLYLLKPVCLIFFKLSLLNPVYEQLLSWDEWIFVFANSAIDYCIFLALFYAFRPGGTMRILREVSQTTDSETRSDPATNVNPWLPG